MAELTGRININTFEASSMCFIRQDIYVAEQKLRLDTQDKLSVADETILVLEKLLEQYAKENKRLSEENASMKLRVLHKSPAGIHAHWQCGEKVHAIANGIRTEGRITSVTHNPHRLISMTVEFLESTI